MPFANYLQESLLGLAFGGINWTPPSTLYVGLSTTAIAENGSGITEPPASANYSRVAVANNTTNWTAPSGGSNGTVVSNATAITFPMASGSWGTIQYFFIADLATGGDILGFGTLTTPQTISTDDIASFAAGALTITLD